MQEEQSKTHIKLESITVLSRSGAVHIFTESHWLLCREQRKGMGEDSVASNEDVQWTRLEEGWEKGIRSLCIHLRDRQRVKSAQHSDKLDRGMREGFTDEYQFSGLQSWVLMVPPDLPSIRSTPRMHSSCMIKTFQNFDLPNLF